MIDTTIRFNDHNSYKITSILMSYPFGVQNMTHITHSFQAYATTALASATRARTKFLDADGATLSEVSHSFAVTTVFGKVEITVAVPATATQAQLVLLQGGTDWWVAETKTEQGEVATPYNVNYQGQVSHLTPNGLYTGMVTANQIVVTGSIAQPDETLETRLVTINNNAINLSATIGSLSSDVSNHKSRLTTIEAGQITLSSRVGEVEPKVTKITSAGVYTGEVVASQITAGTISAARIATGSITGVKLADGSVSDVKIASGLSATKITAGKLQSVDGTSYFDLTNGQIKSNNVDLTGKITATSGSVGGLVVGTNDLTITVSKVYGPFTQTDLDRVFDIVMSHITPTAADYDKYDFFGSGRLTSLNSTVIHRMINGTHGWTNPDTITYQVVFSTSNTNNLITLKNDKSTEKTVIRPASVETSHGRYATLEATNIDAMSFGSNGNVGATGSFKAKNASGNEITVTVTGGLITSIG